MELSPWIGAAILAAVHLFAGRMRFVRTIPRSRWLSFAGGVSVAYVFVRILPELAEGQEILAEAGESAPAFLEHHAYLLALAGLMTFYGIEIAVRRHRSARGGDASPGAFWLHVASFAIYNGVIGSILGEGEPSETTHAMLFFLVAMALHFVVTDSAMRDHHREIYDHRGRWILAAAVFVGVAIGEIARPSETALTITISLLAGGVILNVLKEELPREADSRFEAFLAGAVLYGALLLTIA